MEENITLKVKGMFCSNCESKIETTLLKLKGILKVKASFNNEEVNITYDKNDISQEEIEKIIINLDYKVVKEEKRTVTSQSICILIIILALYIICNHLGLLNVFNIFPTVEASMSYGMLFLVGLLTSVHCISMCGGINLSQSINSVKNEGKILKSNVLYNLGRVISYTVIGGIVGTIGSVITLNGIFKGLIAIIAGIIMIIMGINMLDIFPTLRKFNIRIPKKLAIALNKSKRGKTSFYIGLVNGFMPCGPLQAMQVYALSTGNFLRGAISMFLFSLGTVPLMFGFGTVASKLNKKFAEKMLTVSAIIIFILGIGMLSNGLSLSGININIESKANYENMAEMISDYQTIKTTIDYGSYEPITVKKGIKVKWIINVPKGKLNGCNNEIIIQKYNLDIKLKEGENVIEFIPNEKGVITYTCWMGMIKSTITVID
ncbi:MAG: sulfite exporter TauE/SafE family protein [Clostridia bacterium]